MAALQKDRNIWRRDGRVLNVPVKAGEVIFKGALVATNNGMATPGADASGLRFVGVAIERVDNTNGADGDALVRVWQSGIFPVFKPNAALQDVGVEVGLVDDQTVNLLTITTNDVKCGRITRVLDTDEVELKVDGYAY